jgi:hypothetical protein
MRCIKSAQPRIIYNVDCFCWVSRELCVTAGDKNTEQVALQVSESVHVSEHADMLISAATFRHKKLISSPSLASLLTVTAFS